MTPNLTILYVDSPEKSAAFYAGLFGVKPVEQSATFAIFVFPGGIKLGLWSRHTVEPAATGTAGMVEIAVPLESPAAVDDAWAKIGPAGQTILQAPVDMEFGRTFLLADPDGHRIRFYNPPV
ncbi:VOC family protein [Rhizobium cremeum]|uniref:VOC family protein n=1 Tax=Rhizobium cremeum TaxID=2813827 RepID=UPI000DE05EF0